MMPGAEAYDAIVGEFGREILDDEGRIDRRKLSGIVWNDPERLAKLNSFVHPPVRRARRISIAEIARTDPAPS